MKRHVAGTIAPPGLYWKASPWDIRVVSARAALLEGIRGDRYFRIPPAAVPLAAIVAVVLGGVSVVLLPIVGAVMLLVACAARVWRSLTAPRRVPAHLTRKPG